MMDNSKKITKIVLTGGPCAGKTKVFDYVKKELEEDNYYIISVPETAREKILNGIVPCAEWVACACIRELLCRII